MKGSFFILLTALVFSSCQQEKKSADAIPDTNGFTVVSDSVSYQLIGTYDTTKMKSILGAELDQFLHGSTMSSAEFKPGLNTPRFGMKLYRIRYKSVVPEWGNKPTVSSGLLAIPETSADSLPMISYQHGTVFEKTSVPSIPDSSMETRLMLAQYGSQGYIVIGADYHGLGLSTEPNSYFSKESTEQAMVDMLKASQTVLQYLKIKQGPLFIHGWSQGGYNTLTLLHKLEVLKIPLKGCVTAAGSSEVAGAINRWINNSQPNDAIYLPSAICNFLFAKENYGGLKDLAKQAIKPQYYQLAKDFYEFKIPFAEFYQKANNATMNELLEEDFRHTGDLAISPFWQTLDKMQVYHWKPTTPTINYYGEADEAISSDLVVLGANFQSILGVKNVKVESAGPKADHRCTYVYSLIHSKPFYNSLLSKQN